MSLENIVKTVIAEQLGVPVEDVANSARLVEDLGADSLDLVELVMALEETAKVEVPDEAVERLRTVQDVLDYLQTAQAG